MSEELVPMEEGRMLTVEEVKREVDMIQRLMSSLMKEGEHYGKIPGCGDKPTLLKPGAEKLGFTFRMRPEFEITTQHLGGGHREIQIICRLYSIRTGQKLGEGLGAASTMEGKYRYRTGEVVFTGKPVPSDYWKDRDINLIGGRGFVARKNPDTGQWEIARQGEKVEHDNPADYYNTVLKMAKKRAHVDAIITVTAASDIFTQDVEDMVENGTAPKSEPAKPSAPPKEKPQGSGNINPGQAKAIQALCKDVDMKLAELGEFLALEGILGSPKQLIDFTGDEAAKAIAALQGIKAKMKAGA
jgi:hypothetical protein